MLNKLEEIERKYDELTQLLSDPDVIGNQTDWQKYAKAQAGMTEIVEVYREFREVLNQLEDTEALLKEKLDPDMKEMAEEERKELVTSRDELHERLRILLLPKDPNDEKNVIMEIRAGAGGEEAALFAGDLFKMYTRYAERQGWRTELLSASYTDIGGFKE
nr:PCRF domain-containing protein [Desulfitobacterium hafniense]